MAWLWQSQMHAWYYKKPIGGPPRAPRPVRCAFCFSPLGHWNQNLFLSRRLCVRVPNARRIRLNDQMTKQPEQKIDFILLFCSYDDYGWMALACSASSFALLAAQTNSRFFCKRTTTTKATRKRGRPACSKCLHAESAFQGYRRAANYATFFSKKIYQGNCIIHRAASIISFFPPL